MVSIVSTFIVDIEKNFRGHLPQNCINLLATMAEQQLHLERALNDQQKMIEKLMKVIVLSAEADRMMLSMVKKFNSDHDVDAEMVKNQEFKEE